MLAVFCASISCSNVKGQCSRPHRRDACSIQLCVDFLLQFGERKLKINLDDNFCPPKLDRLLYVYRHLRHISHNQCQLSLFRHGYVLELPGHFDDLHHSMCPSLSLAGRSAERDAYTKNQKIGEGKACARSQAHHRYLLRPRPSLGPSLGLKLKLKLRLRLRFRLRPRITLRDIVEMR
ncbi:hypothetical protein FIBSPDRAFT_226069 [Athelia psychrophila]|uniref:Uncharacterized protein n=1 Tax=Athelia psychrophila TaxID=1759441 RepID=A0A166S8P5_9AGAM|nr:hypothetical protein FIBSPDRAFT_226069 [Fibularhizoctonia sp. CBS 109695]